jgi:hypothetical protein
MARSAIAMNPAPASLSLVGGEVQGPVYFLSPRLHTKKPAAVD